MSGGEAELRQLIGTGQYDQVLVHFLNEHMWPVLREQLGKIGITVWCRGGDIQPWWRRPFADRAEADPAKAKHDSDRRM